MSPQARCGPTPRRLTHWATCGPGSRFTGPTAVRIPAAAYTTQAVVDYLLLNAGVRALLASLVGTPSFVSVEQLNLVLRAHKLPPIVVIDELVAGYDGTVGNVIPEDLFIYGPAGEIGKTFNGVTPASLGMQDDKVIQSETAPGVLGQVWKNHNPFGRWSLVEAIGLPSVGNVDDLFIATVALMAKLVLKQTVHLDGPKTFLAGTPQEEIPEEFRDKLSGEHLWIEEGNAEQGEVGAITIASNELEAVDPVSPADRERPAQGSSSPSSKAPQDESTYRVPSSNTASEPVDYKKLHKPELEALAKERDVEIPSGANKDEIVEALKAADEAAAQ